ncbi:MAG TPA: hypothetical protein VHD37_02275, partial [Candidatus Paceibacterota bacterium]|nr:hypothetical protein [Candidatus Paceibacterota bacterium]
MNSKIMNIGRKAGVTFVALMVLVLPFASARAADFSSGYDVYDYSAPSSSYDSYDYSSNNNSSSGYDVYDYSSPSSSGYDVYDYSDTSSGYDVYDYSSGYDVYDYTPGCTTNCGGGGGGGGCGSRCTPPPPKPAPTCELSISPSRIEYGDSVTVSWDTTNAISAFLSGYGTVSVDGSRSSGAIYGTKTFT